MLHPSALYRDFLNAPERVRRFYPVDYRDPAACVRAGETREYPASRRSAVASILRRQAEGWGLLEASRESLERFARPETLVVVAGQQPGLFGGPLYTIYKAITAISFARDLERASGRPVVPIFWIASDDHDFEEARHAFIGDGAVEFTEFTYPLDAAPRGVSLARVPLGAPIQDLIREAGDALASAAHRAEIVDRLQDSYAPGRRWTDAFARLAGAWVAPWGALVFDPADSEAKRLALPVFEREIELGGKSAEAARALGAELTRAGYHPQIARTGQELNLFWHGETREALRLSGDGTLRLAESGRSIAKRELLEKLREHPEDAGPGVLLRPIMQDHLLPTAAYVGGPSEVAYWAQVNALYPLFDMHPPAIVPRGGGTILEPRVGRTLERFGIPWESLAGDVEVAVRDALTRFLPVDFPAMFEKERAGWIESMKRIEGVVTSFDPSLKAAVDTATGKMIHEGQALEKKLMQVWKRRHEETAQKIRRARESLFPRGGLQERTMSVLGYAAEHGPGLLEQLRDKVGEPGRHVLISPGG
ncbi:MAG TPA: bacillithiol biosynthesis cysteine-adding enzyme BshC [Candidatus Limnocylindrales bacterium]|nr:bacillithiol biosynthesis cysteine-adding enzyme BshC [Candidatus Limnocylindrales bacterium]